MYDFIKLQYTMGTITTQQVYDFAPRWITREQADDITGGKE